MRIRLQGWILLAVVAWTPELVAGEFTINPLRVNLDRATRSGEVTVRNDDAAPLRMQVQAMSWRQDGEGKDKYEVSDDLIFFPRALEILPGESRIIRVGVKSAPVSREETYRLFVEELPPASPANPDPAGTSLQVFLRVGVAVFVAPAQIDRKAEITRLDMRSGLVQWTVSNQGNVYFRSERVELIGRARDGAQLFAQDFPERYFLAGVAKTLRFDIPRDACARLAMLEASVVADNLNLKRKLDVDSTACQ